MPQRHDPGFATQVVGFRFGLVELGLEFGDSLASFRARYLESIRRGGVGNEAALNIERMKHQADPAAEGGGEHKLDPYLQAQPGHARGLLRG